jgi:hypothetical protein
MGLKLKTNIGDYWKIESFHFEERIKTVIIVFHLFKEQGSAEVLPFESKKVVVPFEEWESLPSVLTRHQKAYYFCKNHGTCTRDTTYEEAELTFDENKKPILAYGEKVGENGKKLVPILVDSGEWLDKSEPATTVCIIREAPFANAQDIFEKGQKVK